MNRANCDTRYTEVLRAIGEGRQTVPDICSVTGYTRAQVEWSIYVLGLQGSIERQGTVMLTGRKPHTRWGVKMRAAA